MKFTKEELRTSLLTIAANLGLAEKFKSGKHSNEDFEKMDKAFKEEHGLSFMEAVKKADSDKQAAEQLAAITSLLQGTPGAEGGNGDGEGDEGGSGDGGEGGSGDEGAQSNSNSKELNAVLQQISEMQKTIKVLEGSQDPQKPKAVVIGAPKTVVFAHTNEHAFGVSHEVFSLDRSWNQNTVENKKRDGKYSRQEYDQLMNDFDMLGEQMKSRWNTLHKTNQLGNLEDAISSGAIDYSDLEAEFGSEYLVRRMDKIITYVRKLESISRFFPTRSNVQDGENVTHNFMGRSFTQPYQAGEVFAGSAKFQPEKYKVFDVMFKFKFEDLKELEHEYIGYLNKEGSDPMKWAFIEWIMVQCSIIAHNERELRRVNGVRVEPTEGEPAHFMYASNGILPAIWTKVDENAAWQIDGLNVYDSTTIVDYVDELVSEVYKRNGGTLQGWSLVMNSMDKPTFLKGYREKYKTDANYDGEKMEVKDFPLPRIIGINMGESKAMFMVRDEMIELLENKPGEFFAYYFERRLEQLIAASYAKEGVHVTAGRKFADKAALVASKGKQTNLFVNLPATELADGATTADATKNNMFMTVENAAPTAFTDFVGAVEGVAYRLINGHETNDTTIAKAAKFADITAVYTPTAIGDYLEVIYNPTTDKFIELKRKVGGVITVNEAARAPKYVEQV